MTGAAFGNNSASSDETALSEAYACNAAKWSWLSVATTTTKISLQSRKTYTTTHTDVSLEVNIYTTTATFVSNSTPYTLCDGFPRLDGTTRTSTWRSTTPHTSLDRFLTTQSFSAVGTPTVDLMPTCVIAPSDCSSMNEKWSSSYSIWQAASSSSPYALASHKNAPQPSVLQSSPICGQVSPPTTTTAIADDLVCFLPEASVELLYWPAATLSGHLCKQNTSTITMSPMSPMSPTISGRPNTYVTLNTTLTSPTVYIRLDGRWGYTSAGTTFANQTRILLPYSSTAVSSYCANGNETYGTPLPIDYANLNYPVPADVYRCQPKCFSPSSSIYYPVSTFTIADMSGTKTLRTLYTTAETVFAFSTYPIENLCSTIWDDYAPALMVPRELLSMHPVTELGGGGFCTFSVNEANVFFDPPKALTQMTAAAGPSNPPPATTTVQMPSITAEPAGGLSAPMVTSTGMGSSGTATTSAGSDSQSYSIAVESTPYPAQVESSVSAVDPTTAAPAASSEASPSGQSSPSEPPATGSEPLPASTQADAVTTTDSSTGTGEAVPENSDASPTSTDGAASIPAVISSTVTTETSDNIDTLTSALASPDGNPASSATVPSDQTTNGIAGAIASVLAISPLLSLSSTPIPETSAAFSDPTATHQVSTQRPVPVSVDPAAAIISLLPTLIHPFPETGSPATEDQPAADPSAATAPSPALVWTATDGSEYTFPTVASELSSTRSAALPYSSPVAGVVLTDETTTGEHTSTSDPTGALPMSSATFPYTYTTSLIGTGTTVAGLAGIAVSGTTVPSTAIQTQQNPSPSDTTFPIEGVTSAANRPSASTLFPASLPPPDRGTTVRPPGLVSSPAPSPSGSHPAVSDGASVGASSSGGVSAGGSSLASAASRVHVDGFSGLWRALLCSAVLLVVW